MPNRRQFLKGGVAAGAAAMIGGPILLTNRTAQAAASTLDPTTIPQFVTPLKILPAMPPQAANKFHVVERRFASQVLPAGMPKSTVNGYGSVNNPATLSSPGWTIEATANVRTQVTWENQLVDSHGNFLPPLFTVDPTLHWANPPGGINGRDSMPTFTTTPPPYTGPQPMVVHLHGTHDFEESDGLPETWYLPVAKNIPAGYATSGTDYENFKAEALERWGVHWDPGTLTSVYPNTQRAGELIYHDHVLGMTRLDVHSGLIGFYVISGGDADLPAGQSPGPRPMPGDPPGLDYHDIIMVLTDQTFNQDGSLFFPSTSNLTGPYAPTTNVPPYWNSSFQGDVALVNGQTWPVLTVEPRRYRFRINDMSNFRTYQIKIVDADKATQRPGTWAVPTWLIAADAGLLPKAQRMDTLPDANSGIFMVTTERFEIIVDFTGIPEGTEFVMINDGVHGTNNDTDSLTGVGQLMKFVVGPLKSPDTSTPPEQMTLPAQPTINPTSTNRVSFNVIPSPNVNTEQVRFQLGSITQNPNGTFTNNLELWADPISQVVPGNTDAEWEIWNIPGIGGGHALHIHLVEFNPIGRETITSNADGTYSPSGQPGTGPLQPAGTQLAPWETGTKDTIFAPAGTITRFKAPFDHVSKFLYHCHFVDHEDNEMMRFFLVE
jgi:FtsP/CotA-like multicopper oxidase with cupredoxin domain